VKACAPLSSGWLAGSSNALGEELQDIQASSSKQGTSFTRERFVRSAEARRERKILSQHKNKQRVVHTKKALYW
jgi:hypothetical protein